jgi:hypothetical protein
VSIGGDRPVEIIEALLKSGVIALPTKAFIQPAGYRRSVFVEEVCEISGPQAIP